MHFVVQQKQTQHCKAIVFQLKIRKRGSSRDGAGSNLGDATVSGGVYEGTSLSSCQPYGRKQRGTKVFLDEGERGE